MKKALISVQTVGLTVEENKVLVDTIKKIKRTRKLKNKKTSYLVQGKHEDERTTLNMTRDLQ